MGVITKNCSVANLLVEPNFYEMLEKYAVERALEGLPHPRANIAMYKQLESLGKLYPIAAYFNEFLVGFANVLMAENQHCSTCIAVTESYFVLEEYRKTGAGTLLRREAEMKAKTLGSPGLFITAAMGSNLLLALEGSKDYDETGRIFLKRFGNA